MHTSMSEYNNNTIPEYHKIETIFKRDMNVKGNPIIETQYTLPEFEYLARNLWIGTEKIDGTNMRVHWDGREVRFGGRTAAAQIPAFLLERMIGLFPLADNSKFVQHFGTDEGTNVTLYGEGFGARIQKGGGNYIANGVGFVLFDVRVGDWWLQRGDVEEVADFFGIPVVPVVMAGSLYDAVELARHGFDSAWGPFTAEGLVLRPAVELRSRSGRRIITKIKYRDFVHENVVAKAAKAY